MEFLKQNLGPNKVSINIKSNQFDETIAINNFENDDIKSKFTDFDNIIDIYRGSKSDKIPDVKPFDDKPAVINKPLINKPLINKSLINKPLINNPLDKPLIDKPLDKSLIDKPLDKPLDDVPIYDKLFYIIYSTTDPLMTLLRHEDLNIRIDKFKDELIKNLLVMYKKLELHKIYKESEIVSAIKHYQLSDRIQLITYFSRLLNKCIVIEYNTGNILMAHNDYSEVGFYIKEVDNDFIIEDNDLSKELLIKKMIDNRKNFYLKNDYLSKIDKLLVKNLREIATSLLIPILKLKKNEILEKIKEKFNT
jgi:hypothetical protein